MHEDGIKRTRIEGVLCNGVTVKMLHAVPVVRGSWSIVGWKYM